MSKRMVIDATHPEETRVVVLNANSLEEFDFETSTKKQIKGNIYLAKVARVEPSLQAAFVDYGGNRHGFLSFNDIHPDYYRIPIADRQALADQGTQDDEDAATPPDVDAGAREGDDEPGEVADDETRIEEIGGDEIDEIESRGVRPARRYKIQEVIKRRDIMLVQVVKEERGTKGAALTTYLSLAGRYSVLMPNAGRGGGISRKIVNLEHRKLLKAIAAELPVPEGMGVILRTAGVERSKAEIKRDFNYLLRLWESIRELTLKSVAPALIHEEGNLIKRSIRDLYTRETEEVLVEGDDGYHMAKKFMRELIPSHAPRVKLYHDRIPLFHRYQVESQLDAMHSPTVQLKSGGYIFISPTEALVAIDVNSGKATRERGIEETAAKTNLEAAEEIAHQLRLRDLAGLIVIDFIDMDDRRNVRTVERRFKEAVKGDRARIQMGRISPFGLLELSRQRLRPSLYESSSQVCAYCRGTGHVRSTESTALHVLRAIEEEGIRERSSGLNVFVPAQVAQYILNEKRDALHSIEERYGFRVFLLSDGSLIPPDYRIERVKAGAPAGEASEGERVEAVRVEAADEENDKAGRKRRRRPKRRKVDESEVELAAVADEAESEPSEAVADTAGVEVGAEAPRKRRRRGRRGGRRRRAEPQSEAQAAGQPDGGASEELPLVSAPASTDEETPGEAPQGEALSPEAKPKRARRVARKKPEAASLPETGEAKPKRARRGRRKTVEATADAPIAAEASAPSPVAPDPPQVVHDVAPATAEETPQVVRADEPQPADVEPAAETAERPKRPPRRGWWQE